MSGTLLGHGVSTDRPSPVAVRSMSAIGTAASVSVTAPDRADQALALMAEGLRALDEACSRFRADSELRQLERLGHGRPTRVSALLFDVLEVACVVAVETAGAVDPTVALAVSALGYDRHFDDITDDITERHHRRRISGGRQPASRPRLVADRAGPGGPYRGHSARRPGRRRGDRQGPGR